MTADEKRRLAARSRCSIDTIRKYPHVREASRLRIEEAAKAEGIDLNATCPGPRDAKA